MNLAELAGWTPHRARFGREGALLDWIDLRGIPFREPFLLQTIDAALKATPPRARIATPIAALQVLEGMAPGRDPDGLVFHLSRCGSTLVSGLIGALPGAVSVSEPDAINDLMELDVTVEDEPALVELLRLTVRALGRNRPEGGQVEGGQPYVVKLSSFCVSRAALLRRAFPEVPFVFVSRDPLEVLGSILAAPPGWVQLIRHPAQARLLLRVPEEAVSMDDPGEFLVRGLAGFLEAALEQTKILLVDYTELPAAIPDRILPHFGIAVGAEERARLLAEARFDAKAASGAVSGAGRPVFVPNSARKRDAVPSDMAELCTQWLAPLHVELEKRRRMQVGAVG